MLRMELPGAPQLVSRQQLKEAMVAKEDNQAKQVENTSGGGHVGGTKFGGQADAKTTTTSPKKGPKARPNDGRN